MKRLLTTTALLAALWSAATALPQGGQVVGGNATITQPNASTLTINQSSNRAMIDWQGFDIGSGEGVNFYLPGADGITLNRIYSANGHGSASQIYGNLSSNGQLFLYNPQGILFGAGSQVNVGGLLATTATLQGDFMNGDTFSFAGGTNSIINQGTITTANGGYATLAAPNVRNEGTITTPQGLTQLVGAAAFTLDPAGDGLLTLSPEPMAFAAHVANSGNVQANGGQVAMATQATQAAYASVVNVAGVVEANSFETTGGVIRLGNATTRNVTVAGTVTANGTQNTETGGTIQVIGQFVDVKTGAKLQADGPAGGGTINVGGNYQGNGPLFNATNTRVQSGALLSANATDTGNGGTIIVWADNRTIFNGHASAQGGANGGNGGFIEVSGKNSLAFTGTASTLAPKGNVGMLLLDPANITIVDGAGGADDAEVADGEALEADGGGSDFFIAEQALEALAAGTDIILQATNDITVANLTDNLLMLAATGNVTIQADSDNDGSGNFSMNAGDTIATGGGALTIQGANITIGQLDTSLGTGGNVTLNTTNGGTGTITSHQGVQTNGGAITLNGNLVQAANTTLSTGAGNGAVGINGNTTGDYTLTLNGGTGTLSLQNADVEALALTGGATTLNGALTTDSALDFSTGGNLTLGGNSTIAAQDGGTDYAITFGSRTINGAYSLGLTGSAVTLAAVGNSTPLTALTVNASGAASTANVTTSGAQTYTATGGFTSNGSMQAGGHLAVNSPLTLGGNSTFTSTGGNVTFGNTVNGANTLAANAAAGAIAFNGAVGNLTPLASLTANGSSVAMAGNATTSGNQTYTGATSLNGTHTSSAGALTFNGATTLGGNTSANTSAGNGAIAFNNTVDGAYTLTTNSGLGTTTFAGNVGSITPLSTLTTTGPVTAGNITTAGAQLFNGATTLNGALLSQNAAITLASTLALSGNSAITSGGGVGDDITIGDNLTGAYTLTFNAGLANIYLQTVSVGTLSFAAADDLYLAGNVTTTGTQDYTNADDLILLTGITLNAGGNNITMDSGNLLTGAHTLALNANNITLGQVNGLTTLALTAGGTSIVANTVNTTAGQTYNGNTQLATTLTAGSGNIALNGATTLSGNSAVNATTGNIAFANTLNGANSLAATANGTLTFGGAVGGITPLTDLTLTSNILSMQAFTQTGDFTSTHTTATFNGAGQANDITLNGASIFNATLTAANGFTQNGNATLDGALASNGDLTLNGNITLAGDSTLTSGGGAGDVLTVTGSTTGDYNLTLAAGGGDITLGGNFDINGLTFASGNNLTYAGGTIEADTGIDFTPLSTIYLAGDTNLIGNDGSTRADITTSAVNSILALSPGIDLSVYGDTVTMNQLGDSGSGRLGTLTVDANVASLLGSIFTSGGQTITAQQGLAGFLTTAGGDIVLNTTASLVGNIDVQTNGGNIYILQPLNGGYAMSLNAASGNVYINAALGNITPLTTMDIVATIIELTSPITTTGNQSYTGLTNLGTALTLTLGNITYNSPVTLQSNAVIDTSGNNGTITFNSAVDGAYDLTIRAGTLGDVVFNDTVGASTRLGTLNIESTGNITFAQGAYATNYYQNYIEGLASFGYAPGMNVTNDIGIAVSTALTGRFTGRNVVLDAGQFIEGEVYAEDSLTLTSARSMLSGTLRRQSGRTAARQVQFGFFQGGPHYFNGYNLPVVDDFYSLPSLVAQNITLQDPMPTEEQLSPAPLIIAPAMRNTSETAMLEAPNSTLASVAN